MLFPKRQDFLPARTLLAAGTSGVTFDITREFFIESIIIRCIVQTSASASAALNPNGLAAILKRVSLTVADGARTRNVVECSGSALIEYAKHTVGTVDRETQTALGTALTAVGANTYILNYPIFFAPPQLDDPQSSLFLLPAPRFSSNPQLKIDISSASEMGTTFALAAGGVTIEVIINRRQVDLPNWKTFDTEFTEIEQSYAASGTNQIFELPTPGHYTGLLLRGYTTANARGNPATNPASTTGAEGEFKLSLLGTVLRRFRLPHIQVENEMSTAPNAGTGLFTASYFLDFLTDKNGFSAADLGSTLDANALINTGAKIQLLQDIAGAAGVKIGYVMHRIFGDISALKLGLKK